MRIDWVPYSAAALVLGATALSVGALILPSGNEAATTLQMAANDGGRWLAVAVLYFLAAVTLTLGMPSILTLFQVRTDQVRADGDRGVHHRLRRPRRLRDDARLLPRAGGE